MSAAHFDQDAPIVCDNCGVRAVFLIGDGNGNYCSYTCNLCIELRFPDGIDGRDVHRLWQPAEELDAQAAQLERDRTRWLRPIAVWVAYIGALTLIPAGLWYLTLGQPIGLILWAIAGVVWVLARAIEREGS